MTASFTISTYKEVFPLRIVVVGAGKLGYSIAELLSNEQFDVVVVDHNEERLEVVKNNLDVLTVLANGASPITMNDPDIRGADILVACTAVDEVNMVACIMAKKHGINPAARIRDMQFLSEAKDYLKQNFDIDLHAQPGNGYSPRNQPHPHDAGSAQRRRFRQWQGAAL